jgi:hypothetical protein
LKKKLERNTNTNLPAPAEFVDALVARMDLKNDAQLSRALLLQPPQISKIRNGQAPLTGETILRIHEAGEIPVPEIRKMARLPAPDYPEWIDVIANRRAA